MPLLRVCSAGRRLLCCVDAWLCDAGGRVRALFDAYRGSPCAAVKGCVSITSLAFHYIGACASIDLSIFALRLHLIWFIHGVIIGGTTRCVPGWAYIDGRAYMELPPRDLTNSASMPEQQQFYQVSSAHLPCSVSAYNFALDLIDFRNTFQSSACLMICSFCDVSGSWHQGSSFLSSLK
jgi:hypothetical protein